MVDKPDKVSAVTPEAPVLAPDLQKGRPPAFDKAHEVSAHLPAMEVWDGPPIVRSVENKHNGTTVHYAQIGLSEKIVLIEGPPGPPDRDGNRPRARARFDYHPQTEELIHWSDFSGHHWYKLSNPPGMPRARSQWINERGDAAAGPNVPPGAINPEMGPQRTVYNEQTGMMQPKAVHMMMDFGLGPQGDGTIKVGYQFDEGGRAYKYTILPAPVQAFPTLMADGQLRPMDRVELAEQEMRWLHSGAYRPPGAPLPRKSDVPVLPAGVPPTDRVGPPTGDLGSDPFSDAGTKEVKAPARNTAETTDTPEDPLKTILTVIKKLQELINRLLQVLDFKNLPPGDYKARPPQRDVVPPAKPEGDEDKKAVSPVWKVEQDEDGNATEISGPNGVKYTRSVESGTAIWKDRHGKSLKGEPKLNPETNSLTAEYEGKTITHEVDGLTTTKIGQQEVTTQTGTKKVVRAKLANSTTFERTDKGIRARLGDKTADFKDASFDEETGVFTLNESEHRTRVIRADGTSSVEDSKAKIKINLKGTEIESVEDTKPTQKKWTFSSTEIKCGDKAIYSKKDNKWYYLENAKEDEDGLELAGPPKFNFDTGEISATLKDGKTVLIHGADASRAKIEFIYTNMTERRLVSAVYTNPRTLKIGDKTLENVKSQEAKLTTDGAETIVETPEGFFKIVTDKSDNIKSYEKIEKPS